MAGKSSAEILKDWESFYKSLGVTADLGAVKIPDDPGGFGRVVVVAGGMTPQKVFDLCRGLFPCGRWTDKDLDSIVTSERSAAEGAYAVRARESGEPDGELRACCSQELRDRKVACISFEEHMLYAMKYFVETGRHLDVQGTTLCAGSRYFGGSVPSVHWHGDAGELKVHWYAVSACGESFGSRQVVTV